MQSTDPAQWLEGLRTQVADLRAKTTVMAENLMSSSATVTSKDGAVTVTVSPTGALENLELRARAAELTPAKLTASIMEAVRAGQRSVSEKVVEAFAPIGAGSEAMDLVQSFLPPDPEDESDEEPEGAFARPVDDEPATPSRATPAAPSRAVPATPSHAMPAAPPRATPATPPRAVPADPAPPVPPAKPARSQEPADDVDSENNPW